MRKGWEYKSFETCINKLPKAKQVKTSEYSSGTKYPIISQEDKLISGYYDDESYVFHIDSPVVIFGDHTRVLKYVDFDFVVGADGVKIISPKRELNAKFLLYYLQWYKIPNLGYSRHYKLLKEIDIPLPPLSTQLAIVSELGKINELIRLKKEQLKDFDNLAQSLFYEMFGDPVENEKGWEVKKLGEICEVTSAKRVFINEVVESGVPFIRGTELTALSKLVPGEKMDYTLFITYEHYERLKAITGVPKIGDLLIPSINADGIVWMVDTEDPFYFKDGRVLWVHVNHEYYNSIAIQKLMNVLIKNVFTSMGGATFAELKLFVLRNMNVPTPPLSVQDAFSEKIKQIDAQKLQVKKSIQDLETLLASRMQYWFE